MFTAIKLFFGGLPLANIKNYALIGLAIATLVMYLLWQNEKLRYASFVQRTELLSKETEIKNKVEAVERKNITENVVISWNESVEKLKEYYAKNPNIKYRTIRLQSDTSCPTVSSERESTAGTIETDNGTEQAITLDSEKAGLEVLQCQALIEFNKKQDSLK